ncbi:hypothetical protein [Nocardia lijiangensis]
MARGRQSHIERDAEPGGDPLDAWIGDGCGAGDGSGVDAVRIHDGRV